MTAEDVMRVAQQRRDAEELRGAQMVSERVRLGEQARERGHEMQRQVEEKRKREQVEEERRREAEIIRGKEVEDLRGGKEEERRRCEEKVRQVEEARRNLLEQQMRAAVHRREGERQRAAEVAKRKELERQRIKALEEEQKLRRQEQERMEIQRREEETERERQKARQAEGGRQRVKAVKEEHERRRKEQEQILSEGREDDMGRKRERAKQLEEERQGLKVSQEEQERGKQEHERRKRRKRGEQERLQVPCTDIDKHKDQQKQQQQQSTRQERGRAEGSLQGVEHSGLNPIEADSTTQMYRWEKVDAASPPGVARKRSMPAADLAAAAAMSNTVIQATLDVIELSEDEGEGGREESWAPSEAHPGNSADEKNTSHRSRTAVVSNTGIRAGGRDAGSGGKESGSGSGDKGIGIGGTDRGAVAGDAVQTVRTGSQSVVGTTVGGDEVSRGVADGAVGQAEEAAGAIGGTGAGVGEGSKRKAQGSTGKKRVSQKQAKKQRQKKRRPPQQPVVLKVLEDGTIDLRSDSEGEEEDEGVMADKTAAAEAATPSPLLPAPAPSSGQSANAIAEKSVGREPADRHQGANTGVAGCPPPPLPSPPAAAPAPATSLSAKGRGSQWAKEPRLCAAAGSARVGVAPAGWMQPTPDAASAAASSLPTAAGLVEQIVAAVRHEVHQGSRQGKEGVTATEAGRGKGRGVGLIRSEGYGTVGLTDGDGEQAERQARGSGVSAGALPRSKLDSIHALGGGMNAVGNTMHADVDKTMDADTDNRDDDEDDDERGRGERGSDGRGNEDGGSRNYSLTAGSHSSSVPVGSGIMVSGSQEGDSAASSGYKRKRGEADLLRMKYSVLQPLVDQTPGKTTRQGTNWSGGGDS